MAWANWVAGDNEIKSNWVAGNNQHFPSDRQATSTTPKTQLARNETRTTACLRKKAQTWVASLTARNATPEHFHRHPIGLRKSTIAASDFAPKSRTIAIGASTSYFNRSAHNPLRLLRQPPVTAFAKDHVSALRHQAPREPPSSPTQRSRKHSFLNVLEKKIEMVV